MLQKILTSGLGLLGRVFSRFVSFGRKFGWLKLVGITVFGLFFIATILHFAGAKTAETGITDQTPGVTVASILSLSSNISPISIAGTVNSLSEATVRAEASGQITRVYTALGRYAAAGSILAEVENASQRAAVQQAQGAVDAATAGASVSQTTLAAARTGAVNALLSAYSVVDKSVHADIDPMFSNPEGVRPQFNVQSSNSQAKINVENTRPQLGAILARMQAKSSTLSSIENLQLEIDTATKELRQLRDFLDTVIVTLNSGIATGGITDAVIAGYSTTASTARASVTASLSALSAAGQALEVAQKSSDTTVAQSASQAALTQATAALAAARAGLEKTIVRAPISGTVNSFSLKVGDYLSAGTVAVVIANNGALEVLAYITDADAREIAVGNQATIQNNGGDTRGVVTRIAPAIDPATKKIEVRIGIAEGAKSLVNGQSATVAIVRNAHLGGLNKNARIIIPLAALKIGAADMTIFTVSSSSILEAHPVMIGELLGDRVVLTDGATSDMLIVTDARGLRAGQKVIVR